MQQILWAALSASLILACDAFAPAAKFGISPLTPSARFCLARERTDRASHGKMKMVLVNGETDFEDMTYRQLQLIAKANCVRANQPARILAFSDCMGPCCCDFLAFFRIFSWT